MSNQEYWAIKEPNEIINTSTFYEEKENAWIEMQEISWNRQKDWSATHPDEGSEWLEVEELEKEGYRAVKVKIVEVEE